MAGFLLEGERDLEEDEEEEDEEEDDDEEDEEEPRPDFFFCLPRSCALRGLKFVETIMIIPLRPSRQKNFPTDFEEFIWLK